MSSSSFPAEKEVTSEDISSGGNPENRSAPPAFSSIQGFSHCTSRKGQLFLPEPSRALTISGNPREAVLP